MKELSILLMGMSLIFMFVIAVVLVLYILAYWMIFRKAGEAGWKVLLPGEWPADNQGAGWYRYFLYCETA